MARSRKDTLLLLISGAFAVVLAVALAAGVLTSVHFLLVFAAALGLGLFHELAPAREEAQIARTSPSAPPIA